RAASAQDADADQRREGAEGGRQGGSERGGEGRSRARAGASDRGRVTIKTIYHAASDFARKGGSTGMNDPDLVAHLNSYLQVTRVPYCRASIRCLPCQLCSSGNCGVISSTQVSTVPASRYTD